MNEMSDKNAILKGQKAVNNYITHDILSKKCENHFFKI